MKSCKIFFILLLLFTALANAFSVQFPAYDTVYVDRGIPSHIVVARGCFEKSFPVDEEIGPEPLADSTAVYKAWADSCNSVKRSGTATILIFSATAVSIASGFFLYNHDYAIEQLKV